jgi:hypothetical protein
MSMLIQVERHSHANFPMAKCHECKQKLTENSEQANSNALPAENLGAHSLGEHVSEIQLSGNIAETHFHPSNSLPGKVVQHINVLGTLRCHGVLEHLDGPFVVTANQHCLRHIAQVAVQLLDPQGFLDRVGCSLVFSLHSAESYSGLQLASP